MGAAGDVAWAAGAGTVLAPDCHVSTLVFVQDDLLMDICSMTFSGEEM